MCKIAYSYIRFSSPEQAEGDSLRRQTAGAEDYCKRHGLTLDSSLSLRDLGVSGFKGAHRTDDKHALGQFLKLARDGRVPAGSYLIVENLDRLTREDERKALRLWLDILDQKINIVQLKPETVFRHEKSDMFDVMRAIMELSRGHSESAIKSERCGDAWAEKKADARKTRAVQTKCVPAWLKVTGRRQVGKHMKGGEFQVIPERAALVRRLFEMATGGYGLGMIVKQLAADKVPTWKGGKAWSKAYIHKILTTRTVLGEYQPMKGGKPDGPPVPGFFPAVEGIDEDTWQRAKGALRRRKGKSGRVGNNVASLFGGLLWDARTRERMRIAWRTQAPRSRSRQRRVLVPAGGLEGRERAVSFPAPVFEAAVLSLLAEVRPEDIIGQESQGESSALVAELTALEGRIGQVEEEIAGDGGDVPGLARAMRSLEARRQELLRRLVVARQKEATPLGAAWGEAQTLFQAAQDEQSRLRLRDLLRILVESVWVLVVPRKASKLCAVQINFAEGGRRDYLISYRPAVHGRDSIWECRSLAGAVAADDLDLRRRQDAHDLEQALQAANLDGPGGRPGRRRRGPKKEGE
jgi:DNA invertase Pin-like site-specific DNA recombinase